MDGDATDAVTNGADAVALVTAALDPLLAAYGFATGQASWSEPMVEQPAPIDGMVIYCRPRYDGSPGCEDVVVHLGGLPTWNVLEVTDDDPRGYWSLAYDDDGVELPARLLEVAEELRARVRPAGSAGTTNDVR